MKYLRKVTCPKLKIKAIFDDQSHALRLFTALYDKGYPVTLEDYFVPEEEEIKLDDKSFSKLMAKIK